MSSSLLCLWNMKENEAQKLVDDILASGVQVPNHFDVYVRVILATKNWCSHTKTNVVGNSLKIINDERFISKLMSSNLNHDDKLVFALYECCEDTLSSSFDAMSINSNNSRTLQLPLQVPEQLKVPLQVQQQKPMQVQLPLQVPESLKVPLQVPVQQQKSMQVQVPVQLHLQVPVQQQVQFDNDKVSNTPMNQNTQIMLHDPNLLRLQPGKLEFDGDFLIKERTYSTYNGYHIFTKEEGIPADLLYKFDGKLLQNDDSGPANPSSFNVMNPRELDVIIKALKIDKFTKEKFLEHMRSFNGDSGGFLNLATGRTIKYNQKNKDNGYFFIIKRFPSILSQKAIENRSQESMYILNIYYELTRSRVVIDNVTYSYSPLPGYGFFIPNESFSNGKSYIIPNIFKLMIDRGLVYDLNDPKNQINDKIKISVVSKDQLEDERYARMER